MKHFALSTLILAVGLSPVGCGGGGGARANKTPKVPVGGTVLLDGKPMAAGEVVFYAGSNPAQAIEVKGGAFSGQAFTGKSRVDVVSNKDGPPHPMDPTMKLKVNVVSEKFSGPMSSLSADIPEGGKSDLKFEVTSAPEAK